MLNRSWCALLILWVGCSTAGPQAPHAAQAPSPAAPKLAGVLPTIGARADDLSAREKRKLGLPEAAPGAALGDVLQDGPADRAGLKAGDLVQTFDGEPVTSACSLLKAVAQGSVDQEVKLSVLRGEHSLQATVRLADVLDVHRGACDRGDARGCQIVGAVYSLAGKGAESVSYATAMFRKSCDAGDAEGCSSLGSRYQNGNGVARDDVHAHALWEEACRKGSASACASSGAQYACGCGGAPKDDARAARDYQRSCDLGDANGCYQLGLFAAEGRGAAKDAARAVDAFTQACEKGSFEACSNLGAMIAGGEGTKADAARAAELYRRGCEGEDCRAGDSISCYNLAGAYENGAGVKEDRARAAELYRRACEMGYAEACEEAGRLEKP